MARAKVILVDADVISHFIATDHIYELNEILSPHQLYIVDNVYKEATLVKRQLQVATSVM